MYNFENQADVSVFYDIFPAQKSVVILYDAMVETVRLLIQDFKDLLIKGAQWL